MPHYPSLGAYYQCHKQPKAFLNAAMSYRKHYPDGTFVISNDAGNDYTYFAKNINAEYTYYDKKTGNSTNLEF